MSSEIAASSKESDPPERPSRLKFSFSRRNGPGSSSITGAKRKIRSLNIGPQRQPSDPNQATIPAAPMLAAPGGLQRIGSLLTVAAKHPPGRVNQGNSLLKPGDIWSGTENQAIERSQLPMVEVEEVVKFIKRYKCYKSPALASEPFSEKDLPPFDSLEHYDINEETAFKLWEREAKHLVDAVNSHGGPSFKNPMFDGPVTAEGHDKLGKLCERITDCDTVRIYYNQILQHVHIPALPTVSSKSLKDHHDRVKHIFTTQNLDQTWTDDGGLSALYDVVDYVTAMLARFLTKSAHGPWHIWVLASLATWRAAIKVIARSPTVYFQRALDSGHSQLANARRSQSSEQAAPQGPGGEGGIRNFIKSDFDVSSRHLRDFYFAEAVKIKSFEESVLPKLFVSASYRARDSLTKYDFCTVVYETGLQGFQAHIYQDKHGEILGTSLPSNLRYSASACAIINETIESTEEDIRARASTPPRANCGNLTDTNERLEIVTIERSYCEGDETKGAKRFDSKMQLNSMDAVVRLMLAMSITSPRIVDMLKDYLSMISQTSFDASDVKPYIVHKFDAFFRLYTRSSEDHMAAQSRWVTSLSSGLMTRQKLLSGDQYDGTLPDNNNAGLNRSKGRMWQLKKLGADWTHPKKSEVVNPSNIIEANDIMDNWTVNETGVIVRCRWYVTGVMAIAAILVLGGLGIGFTVNQRLPGVDPFNITTYCWVLAAFVILIGRSIRVENWPWRSFLYAQVECKSVSELHSVTGIHEQLIIAKLLHEERTSILHTRGPHNFAFLRTADNGFSIDVPVTMWTMCLSGLIMTQVVTPQGDDALACLDVRRGTEYTAVVHDTNMATSKSRLACLEVIEKKQKDGKPQYRIRLTKQDLQWTKVKGLFSMPEHDAVLFV